MEYHYFKNDTRTYPPTMCNVMRGLRHRGMRVFNVEPNVRHLHFATSVNSCCFCQCGGSVRAWGVLCA